MRNKQHLFNQINSQHHQMVMQLCLGFVNGERNKAKDLFQEVFINTWNSLENFKNKSSYKMWIYRITVNTCLKSFRQESKFEKISMDDCQLNDLGDENRDSGLTALYRSISKLSEVDRLIIMMFLDDAEYFEIANVIGITEGNLRVRIHRIKQTLKN